MAIDFGRNFYEKMFVYFSGGFTLCADGLSYDRICDKIHTH